MANVAHDSHYVPQAALRRWSADGKRVYAYRLLVSRAEVPDWELRSVRGLAYQDDLYTTFVGGGETDEFERWIAREYEEPGLEAVDKLLAEVRLTPADWHRIIRFVAAQDVRTPLNFIESIKRWERELPDILAKAISESVADLRRARTDGIALARNAEPNAFSNSFRVHIESSTGPGADQALVRTEVAPARSLWIASMRHLLKGAATTLCQHHWSVVEPHGSEEWPLTDHPVLRLNYYRPGQYDFRGGWGNPGSEIMMPISPRQLLYVQVGAKASNRFVFSPQDTQLVQRLIVERAHRWVFARQPTPWIARVRPRLVDEAMFLAERDAWQSWQREEAQAETQYLAPSKSSDIPNSARSEPTCD